MVARPPRLVRARVHDLPPEQAHHVVIVVRVVVRTVVKNVDGVSGLGVDDVINDVVVVADVGGAADVGRHRRRHQEDPAKRQVHPSHILVTQQVSL